MEPSVWGFNWRAFTIQWDREDVSLQHYTTLDLYPCCFLFDFFKFVYLRLCFCFCFLQQRSFFIPKNFWNDWADEIDDEVTIIDPVGNSFSCRLRRWGKHAYFWKDFSKEVISLYHPNGPVRLHFQMLASGIFMMRITVDGEGEISYPWHNNGHQGRFVQGGLWE